MPALAPEGQHDRLNGNLIHFNTVENGSRGEADALGTPCSIFTRRQVFQGASDLQTEVWVASDAACWAYLLESTIVVEVVVVVCCDCVFRVIVL